MFYGWYIVAAGVVVIAFNSAIFIYGFTAYVNPIAATFGWSYAQIALASSFREAESGVLNPLVGMAVDRWSPKALVLIGITLFGLGLLYLSQMTSLATFYTGFVITGLGSAVAAGVVPMTVVARWFKRNVGKASAILAMGFGISGISIPLLVRMLDAYGWQKTMIVLAVFVWAVGIPLSFVFRSRPEDYGSVPDGKLQSDLKGPGSSGAYDFSIGLKEALKTRIFWCIGIAALLQLASVHTVVIHIMPYLTSLGMERTRASMFVMLIPLIGLVAPILYGVSADILQKRHVMGFSVGLTSVAVFLLWLIDINSLWSVLLFIIAFAFGAHGMIALRPPITREYFGTRSLGGIMGLITIFTTIGAVTAPPLAGLAFDTLGTYDPAWLILGSVTMVGAILILTIPRAPATGGRELSNRNA